MPTEALRAQKTERESSPPALLGPAEVLALVPQRPPFRFIDEIVELDPGRIVGRYRFREDEYFYAGHFPGEPITPGVILIEAMGQTALVAFGIYLAHGLGRGDLDRVRTFFTEAQVEFLGRVRPGETVTITARKIYFRKLKLKVEVVMTGADGTPVCAGELAGIGVEIK